MNRYQEWAKRNWPTCQSVNDPDRFVEFSQADLDAYAEKAFAAGARGEREPFVPLSDCVPTAALLQIAQAYRRARAYYWVAATGWLAFVALAIFGRGL